MDDRTVRRDQATAPNDAVDEPREVLGIDGRTRTYTRRPTKTITVVEEVTIDTDTGEREEAARRARQVLARLLSALGWKGKDIAAHLGVTPPAVSQLINGESAVNSSLAEADLQAAINLAPEARHFNGCIVLMCHPYLFDVLVK